MNSIFSISTPTDNGNNTAMPNWFNFKLRPSWLGGLSSGFASSKGRYHSKNEDCCIHFPSNKTPTFCAVADGVGGGAHGEIASRALVQYCAAAPRNIYRNPAKLADWLRQGDNVVREAIARRSNKRGASTLVAAWFPSESQAYVTNIGDCRAYKLRPKYKICQIERITEDQTYNNLGLKPPVGSGPHDPACMAGVGAIRITPILSIRLDVGELLLLCSDGFHKTVQEEEITSKVREGLLEKLPLHSISEGLVEMAKINGSNDDVSVLLVQRHRWFGASLTHWFAFLVAVTLAILAY